MHKSYYAIIPANVRYDKELKANAKLLYGEITALCNERGFCWASNSYFADLYKVNKETISRWISQLSDRGYINIEIIYKEGTNQIINRYIRISQYPIDEKVNTPIDEKVKENNTVINTTSNNTKNSRKRVYDESSIHYILAKRLYDKILENDPDYKEPNLQKWANDIRLTMERDNRTEEQIIYVIDWCQNNDFWKSNILSASKLREKFSQLIIQIKSDRKKNKPIRKPNYEVSESNEGSNGKHSKKSGHVRLFK